MGAARFDVHGLAPTALIQWRYRIVRQLQFIYGERSRRLKPAARDWWTVPTLWSVFLIEEDGRSEGDEVAFEHADHFVADFIAIQLA